MDGVEYWIYSCLVSFQESCNWKKVRWKSTDSRIFYIIILCYSETGWARLWRSKGNQQEKKDDFRGESKYQDMRWLLSMYLKVIWLSSSSLTNTVQCMRSLISKSCQREQFCSYQCHFRLKFIHPFISKMYAILEVTVPLNGFGK